MVTTLIILLVTCLVIGLSIGINALPTLFCSLLYSICKWILVFIDFMQSLVRKLCGLDDAGDILFDQIIRSNEVKIALLAILVLSIILVFGFALVQIIRLQYTTEGGKNAVGPLIKTCLKSIFLFVLIPFVSFVGIYFSNQLLKVVDSATSTSVGGSSTSIAGRLFVICAQDANPYRTKEVDYVFVGWNNLFGAIASQLPGGDSFDRDTGIYTKTDGYTNAGERKVYKDGNNIAGAQYVLGYDIQDPNTLDQMFQKSIEEAVKVTNKASDKAINLKDGDLLNFSDADSVYYFYNLTKINYILLFMGSYFLFKTLISIIFGLVMRLYKVAILFIISPYPVSLTVLDNGSALNKWKGKFLAELFSAYGTIAGLNLFMTLLPIMNKVTLFTSDKFGIFTDFFNYLVQLIFMLVGFLMIKDIVGIISEFVGGGNVLSQGEGMAKQVGDIAKKAGSAAVSVGMGGIALAQATASQMMANHEARAADKQSQKQADEMNSAEQEDQAANNIISDKRNGVAAYLKADQNVEAAKKEQEMAQADLDNIDEQMKNVSKGSSEYAALEKKRNAAEKRKNDADAEVARTERIRNGIGVDKNALAEYNAHKDAADSHRKKANEYKSNMEARQDKFYKHQAGALRGKQVVKNMVSSSKIVQSINKSPLGVLSSESRAKLDKQIKESSDDAATVMTAEGKRKQNADVGTTRRFAGYVNYNDKGESINDISTNIGGKGLKKFSSAARMSTNVAKFTSAETQREQDKEVGAVIDEASLNNLRDALIDALNNGQNGSLSDSAIDNLIANKADFVESADLFGGSGAAKEVEKMINALEKSRNTTNSADKTKALADAQDHAKNIKVDSLAKIDSESIRQMREAIKAGMLQQSVNNKNYGAALDKVIYKAMNKALEHTQNVKNDPKTDNIIPQLLRELLAETKKKK